MDDTVNDRFADSSITIGSDTAVPSFWLKLRAEDNGTFYTAGFDDLEKFTCLLSGYRTQQEFIQDQKINLLICPYHLFECTITVCNSQFI